MSKQKTNVVNFQPPTALSRDQFESMSLRELEELRARYTMELSVLSENSDVETRPWEVELSYVDRAIVNRRAYEAITPPEFWN